MTATDDTAATGWRDRCIDEAHASIWHGQRLLGVHALIARERAAGGDAVSITDLLAMIGGELPEPNSVSGWGKQPGGLDRLIADLFASASRTARTEAS